MSGNRYAKHSYHGKNWKLVLSDYRDMLAKRGLGTDGAAQRFVDSEVLRRCVPYVPFEVGELLRSGIRETKIGSGQVVYRTPYARRHYYNTGGIDALGRRFGPSRFEGAPHRGSHWFERMKSNGGREAILRAAAKIMGAKAK